MLNMNRNPLDNAPDGDLKGARRATEESPSLPDPEVEVKTERRRFTSQYKLSILKQADQCQHSGEIGALLRREGLYSSHLSTWRRLRREGYCKATTRPQAQYNGRRTTRDSKLRCQVFDFEFRR